MRMKMKVDWLHERGLEFFVECNSGLYASETGSRYGDAGS